VILHVRSELDEWYPKPAVLAPRFSRPNLLFHGRRAKAIVKRVFTSMRELIFPDAHFLSIMWRALCATEAFFVDGIIKEQEKR
jgi:hypothetical protein